MYQNITATRREMIKNLAMLAGTVAMISPASALATAVGPTNTEIASERPKFRQALLQTMEVAVGSPNKYLPKASALQASINQGPAGESYPVQAWRQLLSNLRGASAYDQITAVHQFFNQVTYVTDNADTWRMPNQFLCEGGDCEDYAIAKLITLRLLGFHQDRVRVLFVKNTRTGIDHAVTVVYMDGKALILDNNQSHVVRPEAVAYYQPICSFDDRRLWLHWVPGDGNKAVATMQQRVARQG